MRRRIFASATDLPCLVQETSWGQVSRTIELPSVMSNQRDIVMLAYQTPYEVAGFASFKGEKGHAHCYL